MAEENKDHDLLIRLSTQFESLEKSQSTNWANLNDKFAQLLSSLNEKANKEDFRLMAETIKGLDGRVIALEDNHKTLETKKQVILNLGNTGIKFWGFLVVAITFLMGVYNQLFGTK